MSKTIYPVITDTDALPLVLAGIGEYERTKRRQDPAGEPYPRIIITTEGECALTVNGQDNVLRSGSIVCIPPEVRYSAAPGEEGWSAKWISLGGSMSAEMMQKLGNGQYTYCAQAQTEECENLFGQIMTEASAPIPRPELVSTLLYAFLLAVRKAEMQKDTESYAASINASVDHMNRHYSEDITLERLAAISGISLQHFCRVFRSKLGMRPMEYLARVRVTQAKILLDETDEKINDIAKAVGFGDQNYFGLTFRKYEGVSPTEYRKEHGGRNEN